MGLMEQFLHMDKRVVGRVILWWVLREVSWTQNRGELFPEHACMYSFNCLFISLSSFVFTTYKIPHSHIFDHIKNSPDSDTEYAIKCSYLEIYNEMIQDLFNPNKQSLKIHESPNKGVWIGDLTEEVTRKGGEN